jgi:hypothetical protein
MARVPKPMKLVALRIDEEQKARLERLAEERGVTLSRAFREGALLYLNGLLERTQGANVTFHGVRRGKDGRRLNKPSLAQADERAALGKVQEAVYARALGGIREAWEDGIPSRIILAALGEWLRLAGRVYALHDEVGANWFLRDYCPGYGDAEAAAELRRLTRDALVVEPAVDVGAVLDALGIGFLRMLDDARTQQPLRKAILTAWSSLGPQVDHEN